MNDILYIKDMVCVRCVMAVKAVLTDLDIPWVEVSLGRVELPGPLEAADRERLAGGLRAYELELMGDRRQILVERIRTRIIELVRHEQEDNALKLSEYLSLKLHHDYTYLSNHYSQMQGSTIEQFYLRQRVERVKELMVYEGLTVTEISYRLRYSSVSHLCAQFRKITGITPATFKKNTASPQFNWRDTVPAGINIQTREPDENE